jgi:hypothetical protein
MVLAALDVPDDFAPISTRSGPVDVVSDATSSSYVAIYRPKSPPAMIVSQTLIFFKGYDVAGYLDVMTRVRRDLGDKEISGPVFGDQAKYYEGKLPDHGMYGYTAFWRYSNLYCELWVAGQPGRFGPIDIARYAEIQHRRARAVAESGWVTESR